MTMRLGQSFDMLTSGAAFVIHAQAKEIQGRSKNDNSRKDVIYSPFPTMH
jgi:hypothetical protein